MISKREAAAQLELEQMIAATNEARQSGLDYFRDHKDDMLVAVARHASTLWPADKALQMAFLQGYSAARIAHDDYKRGE